MRRRSRIFPSRSEPLRSISGKLLRTAAVVLPWLLWLATIGPLLSEDLSPDVLRIAHVMNVNRDLLKPVNQYTCLETITRGDVEGRKRQLKKRDVVQVDVGVGSGREIYSWPGADQFSSQDIAALIGHGLVANGLFQAFAESIFSSGDIVVKPAGEQPIGGRPAFHFTYAASSLQEQWDINWLGTRGAVGYRGEFWVDKTSFALVRLIIRATDIPPSLPLQRLTIVIDYQPPAGKALIPESALFTAVELNGKTGYDSFVFSHCHIFEAESRVSSDELGQAVEQYEEKREFLPGGLTIPVTLATTISSVNARIGDPIEGVLDKAVRISSGLTAPRGAELKGRIREFDRLADLPNSFIVGLEFDELKWPGHSFSFFAEPVSLEPIHGVASIAFVGSTRSGQMGPGGLWTASTTERIWASAIPGAATFLLQDSSVLSKGFRILWHTKKVAKH